MIRNAGNELVVNSTIGVRVSILQGSATGEAVYVEIHAPLSNANGLITCVIGACNAAEGQFSEIDWSDGPFYLKTEADPGGGTDYSISEVTQFLSVPYAMYAEESEGINEVFDLLNRVLEELDYLKNLAGVGTVTDIDGNTYQTIGGYVNVGFFGFCWSSSELSATHAWTRGMFANYRDVNRSYGNKRVGVSIRCFRDTDN